MENCDDFVVVKEILEHCNKEIKEFDKIQFRGGNDESINELTARLRNHFIEKKYVDDNLQPQEEYFTNLRHITFYLILNTKCDYEYNLNECTDVSQFIGQGAQLSKCLLMNIIWPLKLERFFYEIIRYTPVWFSSQFAEATLQSLKYIYEPYEVLEKVENILKSMYSNITNYVLRANNFEEHEKMLILIYDTMIEMMRQFYTPNMEKLEKFSEKELFKYLGFSMKHILDMVLHSFDGYENDIVRSSSKSNEIYEIGKEIYPFQKELKLDCLKEIRVMQLKLISAQLTTLQCNVILVSLKAFIEWVEIDLEPDLTLQKYIGERAYYVLERMSKNDIFEPKIDQHLESIAIRPKPLQEIIQESTIGEILCQLDGEIEYNQKTEWFKELFQRNEIAFGNKECLNSILSHYKLMSTTNVFQIIDYLKQQQQLENDSDTQMMDDESDSDDEESEKNVQIKIILKSLDHFNTEQLIEICKYAIESFGENYDCMEQPGLDDRCTEFFNKYTDSFDLNLFLQYSFENPKDVWKKFFHETFTTLENVKNFCQTIKKTIEISNVYFESLFKASFTTRDQCEDKLFPNLIAEIYFQLYQDRKMYFFKNFINQNCTEILNSKNLNDLMPILKALIKMSLHKCPNGELVFGEVTAPVLLMSAQIMDECRWDLISYSDLRDLILRNCIEFIQNVSKKFLPVASEKDKMWINKVIQSYRPFTQYYFQKYALPIDCPQKTFDKFLHPENFECDSDIEKFLIGTFVRCTSKETEWLAKSNDLLPHISDVMITLNQIMCEMGDDVLKLHRHCMNNYAKILRKYLLPLLNSDPDTVNIKVRDFSLKLLNFIDSTPQLMYEEIFLSFHPIAMECFETLNVSVEEELIRDIKKLLSTMKDCKGKEIFSKKFLAITTENSN